MRMWQIPPNLMCRQHLLGEHVEMHMFAGSLVKGISMKGYIDNGLLDLPLLKMRHDELVHEMTERGYNHRSPLTDDYIKDHVYSHAKVPDFEHNVKDLAGRCVECADLMKEAGLITQCLTCKVVDVTYHESHVMDEQCDACQNAEQAIRAID
jgi:hypothetical protein